MARKNISVLEVCLTRAVATHGTVRGGTVGGRSAAFVTEWAQYQRETGHDPGTVLEYARWAHVNDRTMFRRLAEFRELFPEHETPAPLAALLDGARSRSTHSPVPA